MSLKAMVWAFDKKLDSPSTKLLLLCLAHHAGFSNECWPSVKILAAETELSKRTIIRIIQRLEAEGFLVRLRSKRDDGRYGVNKYVLTLPGDMVAPGPGAKSDAPGANGGTTIRTENRTKKALGFHVKEGSSQWEAWKLHLGKSLPLDRNFGWFKESEWPPGSEPQQPQSSH